MNNNASCDSAVNRAISTDATYDPDNYEQI